MPVQLCAEGGPTGGRGQKNIVAAWPAPAAIPRIRVMNMLSLCRHCHPADGTFDSGDTLVHVLFLQISLQRWAKKSKRARSHCNVKHQWQETIDYIIRFSVVQRCTLVDRVAATKFKTTKINSGGFVWLFTKSIPYINFNWDALDLVYCFPYSHFKLNAHFL